MPLSQVDPENYPALLDAKSIEVQSVFDGLTMPSPTIVASPPTGFRMRAEFRMWHDGDALDYVMFHRDAPKDPVPIHEFVIAHPTIQALMPTLRERLKNEAELRRKLFQVEFLSTLSGEMLVTLIYHRPLTTEWEEQARALAADLDILLIGRSRKQKIVLERDYVNECLPIHGRDFHYRQYEQGFTQPNARVNIAMIEWACNHAATLDGDLLELYCGNGNFTLPLSLHFDSVVATELAKVSVRSAQHNLERNQIENVEIIRLSAEETSQAMANVRPFRRLAHLPRPLSEFDLRTVLVDPPRAGLDPQTCEMVQGFERILYISCNPHTLADNLRQLDNTHEVVDFALFDQFPYTHHMECGVLLRRR